MTIDSNKISPFPWTATAGVGPDREGRLIIEDSCGHPVCAMSLRGVQGRLENMRANAEFIEAATRQSLTPNQALNIRDHFTRLIRERARARYENRRMRAVLEELAQCDLNDDNCASLDVANGRVRALALKGLGK